MLLAYYSNSKALVQPGSLASYKNGLGELLHSPTQPICNAAMILATHVHNKHLTSEQALDPP